MIYKYIINDIYYIEWVCGKCCDWSRTIQMKYKLIKV